MFLQVLDNLSHELECSPAFLGIPQPLETQKAHFVKTVLTSEYQIKFIRPYHGFWLIGKKTNIKYGILRSEKTEYQLGKC